MPSESIDIGPPDVATRREEAVARLRAVIESDYPDLRKRVVHFISTRPGRRTREEVSEMAAEALGEAARRVLENPGNYDPVRSAFAWIAGVAMRVVGERTRGTRLRSAQLTDEGWRAIEDRRPVSEAARAAGLARLSRVLDRLTPAEREAVERGHNQRLTGEALAEALGMRTGSAARSRVYRALLKARDLGRSEVGEVGA